MKLHDQMSQARLAGYSWDEIHNFLDDKKQQARGVGYSDNEINSYLGYQDPAGLMQKFSEIHNPRE